MNVKNTVFYSLVATLFTVGLISCNIDQRESTTITTIKYFRIEPVSLLESIAQGKTDAFTSVKDEPGLASSTKDEPVDWDQSDYFRIADALHELVWKEPLETWGLYRMNFSLGCDQTDLGFQYAQFLYFKVVNVDGKETRIAHFLEIDPSRNFAQAMETQYYPNFSEWKTINLDEVKVSSDEALQIAERNGGSEKRQAAKNECGISVGMSQDTIVYNGWLVNYSPSIFTDQIDPFTGE